MREKQQIANFIVFGLNRLGLEPMIYHVHTRGERANYYTTDAVCLVSMQLVLECIDLSTHRSSSFT